MGEAELADARLIEDRFPFSYQVKSMAVHSQGAIEAVRQGVFSPNFGEALPGTLAELQPQIADIVARLSKVPFDDIARDLRGTLGAARNAITQLAPDAQRALAGVERTLAGVQQSLNRLDRNLLDSSAPVQRPVEDTMIELQRAAQALRTLGEYLQRHPESILRGKPADAPLGSDAGEKTR